MQAHHVFPQARRFSSHFRDAGINIHEPRFGTWVETSVHQGWSHRYNAAWGKFFDANPSATAQQIFQHAVELSKEFGFSINFDIP